MPGSANNVSIRLGMTGDADVKRQFEGVGASGTANLDAIGAAADRQNASLQRLAENARRTQTAQDAQRNFNSVLGVGASGNSARQSAAVFREAADAEDLMAAKATALRAAIDPLGAASQKMGLAIKTADDLVGLKIRTPVAPSLVTLFKTLKAAPLAMQFTELYSALQTHIADAQENPLALIQATKLYEVQKYCSLTAHVWDGHWWVCNAATWNGLPEPVRQVVAKGFNDAALKERADIASKDASVRGDLESKGLVFNTADTTSFREGLRTGGFYKDWRERLGAEPFAILEKYAGKLG